MSNFVKLHISPCPNDTFTFHAMIHGLVDTSGMRFSPLFDDIDVLNHAAIEQPDDEQIIKVSYGALPAMTGHFRVSTSGSALGFGNGPLLVSKRKIYPDELHDAIIAIPGAETTAAALLRAIYPQATRRRVYLFSDIAAAVADSEVDAGVLIHEGRFTYRAAGLRLVADLGHEWESLTSMPIPLGGILINRDIDPHKAAEISAIIRRSIEFAMANPAASADYVREHARELSPQVLQSHISLFVNDYSLALNETGRNAIERLVGADAAGGIEYV